MVIALAGRKGCGKTEVANMLCQYGSFMKISFAGQIKSVISNILHITIEELNEMKEKEINTRWGKEEISEFSMLTSIPENFVAERTKGIESFKTIRQMLQILATSVIREYDQDWHANKTIEIIKNNPKKNFVVDDLRFKNEKMALEKIGAEMWYVVRPRLDNISNHESETSLTWKDFGDKILINNGPLYSLLRKWRYYFDYCLMTDTFLKKRNKYVSYLENGIDVSEIAKEHGMSVTELQWEMTQLCIPLEKYSEIPEYDLENGKLETNKKMTKLYYAYLDGKRKKRKEITNPLSIENLKIYLPMNN